MSEGLFFFLLGTAVALGIPAFEQPRWNARRYIYVALSCICLLAIPAWSLLASPFPSFANSIASLPNSPSAWFTLAMVLFVVSLPLFGKLWRQPLPSESLPDEKIDWNLWKQMDKYTARELPRILAKIEPTDSQISDRAKAIQRLLFEHLKEKKIPYIETYFEMDRGTRMEKPVSFDTEIKRPDALKWAETNSIDISHIK